MAAAEATLARAIEAFKGATAGSKGHNEINSHLEHAYQLATNGRKDPQDDSPGRREAGLAAHQREIPAERGHDGGTGSTISNHPAPTPGHGETPGEVVDGAVPESRGNVISTRPGPAAPSGQVDFRTIAASRAADTKYPSPSKTSGGNARSNPPGPAAAPAARIGEAPAPSKGGPDRNSGDTERQPASIAKEDLGPDQWQKAAAGARKVLQQARK